MYANPRYASHRTQSTRLRCLRFGHATTGVVEAPFLRIFRFRMYWCRLTTTVYANDDPGSSYMLRMDSIYASFLWIRRRCALLRYASSSLWSSLQSLNVDPGAVSEEELDREARSGLPLHKPY